jgi:hypothetical protein
VIICCTLRDAPMNFKLLEFSIVIPICPEKYFFYISLNCF